MTKIVGILNVTPDSFSDGGCFLGREEALRRLDEMLEEGVDVVDVGAESTRPGAVAVGFEEEWRRLSSVLPEIVRRVREFSVQNGREVLISIDSYNFETIKKAYDCGVDIINDVSGLRDERVVDFVAKNGVKVVLMHNLAIASNPDIVVNAAMGAAEAVFEWGRGKIADLEEKGVKKSQIIFDPGIGFAKNAQQSIRILKNIAIYRDLGVEIYVGHSKKRFLDEIYRNWAGEPGDMVVRGDKTVLVSEFLVAKGVDYLRVHDVGRHVGLV